jgi:hypothetical protein
MTRNLGYAAPRLQPFYRIWCSKLCKRFIANRVFEPYFWSYEDFLEALCHIPVEKESCSRIEDLSNFLVEQGVVYAFGTKNRMAEKVSAATTAEAGIVSTQAQTIRLATPQRTAERRVVDPTPTIAPVMVCVVLTGMP